MYQQHNKQEVHAMLQQYRIGTLKGARPAAPAADPYAHEPARHPALLARAQKPFNAETPPEVLSAGLVTPNDMFYVGAGRRCCLWARPAALAAAVPPAGGAASALPQTQLAATALRSR